MWKKAGFCTEYRPPRRDPPFAERRFQAPVQAKKERITAMVEATTVNNPHKPKSKPGPFEKESSRADAPQFDSPKFEFPRFEVPVAFHEFAEKGLSQARHNWERMRAMSEEATGLIEGSYTTASKGMIDYGLKLIEVQRANTNAAFDLASELMSVKSVSEAVELSSAHARKQFETMTEQTKELVALAQKVASETSEPIKESVASAFKKVA
jgi:phasin